MNFTTCTRIKNIDELEDRLNFLYDSYDEAVARHDSYVAGMRKSQMEALEWVLGTREDF
jgi:hypothetical protein